MPVALLAEPAQCLKVRLSISTPRLRGSQGHRPGVRIFCRGVLKIPSVIIKEDNSGFALELRCVTLSSTTNQIVLLAYLVDHVSY